MRLFYVFDGALHRRPNSIADNTQVYLADEVEAMKAGARERVALIFSELHGIRERPCKYCYQQADRIMAAIFEDGK